MSLILLPRVAPDSAHEVTYLTDQHPFAAEGFRLAIIASLRLIERNNAVGRHSQTAGIREWSVPDGPYVIPYRIKDQDVEILRIWHTSRRQPKQW
jgi:toxin ParE1/3/4